MNKGAILHIPLSQYAYAEDEHTLVIRIRTAKGDVKGCKLFYGDRVDPQEPIRMKCVQMQKVATDDVFDYYETKIEDIYTRVCYYFQLNDGVEEVFYYQRDFGEKIEVSRTEYFQFPYIRREDIIQIPDWAKDMVMYHIFPDSFATGKGMLEEQEKKYVIKMKKQGKATFLNGNTQARHGGTLKGVQENLNYIKELGCNCIYLNPIFLANSYHKYDTADYFSIDPCFGKIEDLKELVQMSHSMGIRVILDGVFNHCGPDFFAFRDVVEKGKASAYYDWFYEMPVPVKYEDEPEYEAFAYVKEMPKLNTGNHKVEEYFCKVGTYWIKETDIDGWRLDVANEINHDFWRRFRSEIQRVKPEAILIGEIWEDAQVWLKGDQFHSTMNYTFSYLCKDFFAEERLSVSEFDALMVRMMMRYPKSVSLAQMNFLDSHDIPRFLFYCRGNQKKLKLALFYLFMAMGVPSIFYGDEQYIEGNTEETYRAVMPWNKKENCVAEIANYSRLRREHEALRSGEYRTMVCQDDTGIYVFARETKSERLLVVLNRSDTPQTLEESWGSLKDLDSGIVEKKLWVDGWSGKVYSIEK